MSSGPPARYRVEFARPARKEFADLPRLARERLAPKIGELAENPKPHGVKKLKGFEDLYRISVGDYRVVYTIFDDRLVVMVVRVADRRDVYRRKGN